MTLVIEVMLQVFHFNNFFVVYESIAQILQYAQYPSPRVLSILLW